ncbi:MAG TPA: hypothetical protein VEK38_04640 [Candidatus Bathyarchaeia archaeon]|nr:hypothetical protein [Candidatus Bathyarchaeia archaeon]
MKNSSGGVTVIVSLMLTIIVMVITLGYVRVASIVQRKMFAREKLYSHYYMTYGMLSYATMWWNELQKNPSMKKRYEKKGFVKTVSPVPRMGYMAYTTQIEIVPGLQKDTVTARTFCEKKMVCCLQQDIEKMPYLPDNA